VTILTNETAVCPIDGTRFDYTGLASYGTYGCDLDGLPISLTVMPHKIPACPTCRFPVWIRDLSDADLATARELVASPEHEGMTREAPYAHFEYLLEGLGRSTPVHRANNWLKACWQTPVGTPRYHAYARRLAEATDAASDEIRRQGLEEWVAFQTFVANVERQAGLWGAAEARLDQLESLTDDDDKFHRRIVRTRALIAARDGRRADDQDDRQTLSRRR
jgi:hypothetical protein